MLKTLALFAVFVAIAYVALVRHRGWHVEHYSSSARRAHFTFCLVLAVLVATVVSYLLRDEVLCPAGSTYHDVIATETQTGKAGIGIKCFAADGTPVSGSVFAGVCAWLGMSILVFATSSTIWRRFGPPAPAAPAEAPAARIEVPSDKRDRRRERNRARRERERRR